MRKPPRLDFGDVVKQGPAGGVIGLLFVALDAVLNDKGGYLRKTSSTLGYLAKRRRKKVQKVMGAVLEVPPFDALPGEMGQMLATGRDEQCPAH